MSAPSGPVHAAGYAPHSVDSRAPRSSPTSRSSPVPAPVGLPAPAGSTDTTGSARTQAADSATPPAEPPDGLAFLRRWGTGADVLGGQTVRPGVMEALRRRAGRGVPLPRALSESMGEQLGADLTSVRLHVGDEAGRLSQQLQAQAFTVGRDVYFAPGQYNPDTDDGRRLLAHELTHVTQAGAPAASHATLIGRADDPAERHADETADRVMDALHARVPAPSRRSAGLVQPAGAGSVRRLFLATGAAQTAFGEGFMDAHLDEWLPAVNKLVAGLPDAQRLWMENLAEATKFSLLHQVGDRRSTDIVERICGSLTKRDPSSLPNPSIDAVAWPFLLEVARPDRVPEDMGMLGKLPTWVAKLRQVYADAEVRALERDIEGFHRAAERGREHLATVRAAAASPGTQDEPRAVMSYLTKELSAWLLNLYRGAASSLGLTEYALLAVGSVGREEMFPRSDVDYTVLVDALTTKVAAVDMLISMQLQLMGEPQLDEIGKGDPSTVAKEHVVSKRDILLDARTLHAEGAGGRKLEQDYFASRRHEMANAPRRHEAATALIDTEGGKFAPSSEYLRGPDKDVKKGLLRLPTFVTRNLGFYFDRQIEQLNVWDRVKDLVEQGILSKALGDQMIEVVNFASSLRIKLHSHYHAENDTFRLRADAGPSYRGYVLTASEESTFQRCVAINTDLQTRSQRFTLARSMTLPALRKGAVEEPPTVEMGTGRSQDVTTRITRMKLADGREATLKEETWKDEDEPYTTMITLDGVVHVVEPVTQIIKRLKDGKRIYNPSIDNPFAT